MITCKAGLRRREFRRAPRRARLPPEARRYASSTPTSRSRPTSVSVFDVSAPTFPGRSRTTWICATVRRRFTDAIAKVDPPGSARPPHPTPRRARWCHSCTAKTAPAAELTARPRSTSSSSTRPVAGRPRDVRLGSAPMLRQVDVLIVARDGRGVIARRRSLRYLKRGSAGREEQTGRALRRPSMPTSCSRETPTRTATRVALLGGGTTSSASCGASRSSASGAAVVWGRQATRDRARPRTSTPGCTASSPASSSGVTEARNSRTAD